MNKSFIFLIITSLMIGCTSAPKKANRLAQQKQELESLGFQVEYKK